MRRSAAWLSAEAHWLAQALRARADPAGEQAGGPLAGPGTLMLPPLAKDRCTIGRDRGCDLTLGDERVSRWHATLTSTHGSWYLSDLGSTNGTRLNGWRVTTPVHVLPGDWVSFGPVSFVVADRPGRRPAPAGPARAPCGPPASASP